jgi:hypothetical protein
LTKVILGPGAKLRGYLREGGDRFELLSPGGRLLAVYLVTHNQTIRPSGQFVGYGNLLMTLLEG